MVGLVGGDLVVVNAQVFEEASVALLLLRVEVVLEEDVARDLRRDACVRGLQILSDGDAERGGRVRPGPGRSRRGARRRREFFCLGSLNRCFLCLAGSEQLLCVSYFFSEKFVTRFLMSRFLNTRN